VDVVQPSGVARNVPAAAEDIPMMVELVPSESVLRTESYGWLTIKLFESSSWNRNAHRWKNVTYQLNEKGPYGKVTLNAFNREVTGWGKLLKESWNGEPLNQSVKLEVGYWKAPGVYQYMVHIKADLQPSGETKMFSSKPITIEIVKSPPAR
jgi:hypothetical protein